MHSPYGKRSPVPVDMMSTIHLWRECLVKLRLLICCLSHCQSILPGGKIPGHFYEKLHQWEEAKKVYEEELLMERTGRREGTYVDPSKIKKRTEATLGRMRCLEELGEW